MNRVPAWVRFVLFAHFVRFALGIGRSAAMLVLTLTQGQPLMSLAYAWSSHTFAGVYGVCYTGTWEPEDAGSTSGALHCSSADAGFWQLGRRVMRTCLMLESALLCTFAHCSCQVEFGAWACTLCACVLHGYSCAHMCFTWMLGWASEVAMQGPHIAPVEWLWTLLLQGTHVQSLPGGLKRPACADGGSVVSVCARGG